MGRCMQSIQHDTYNRKADVPITHAGWEGKRFNCQPSTHSQSVVRKFLDKARNYARERQWRKHFVEFAKRGGKQREVLRKFGRNTSIYTLKDLSTVW